MLVNPRFDRSLRYVMKHRSATISIYCLCSVEYTGRANSTASLARRLVLVKPDNTVLIHVGEKREPMNWQPPGSVVTFSVANGRFLVISKRQTPNEVINISIHQIFELSAMDLELGQFVLQGTEAEMVKKVMETPAIIMAGMTVIGREVQTPFGTIDLLGSTADSTIVMEFKRRRASLQDVSQTIRYYEYMLSIKRNVRAYLIAPGISANALKLAEHNNITYFHWKD